MCGHVTAQQMSEGELIPSLCSAYIKERAVGNHVTTDRQGESRYLEEFCLNRGAW